MRRISAALVCAYTHAAYVLAACLLVACNGSPKGPELAEGPGSETETLTGVAFLPNGEPAVDARIALRPKDFLKESSPLLKSARTRADARTDSKGVFRIDSLERGSYLLEVNKDDVHAGLLPIDVNPQATGSLPDRIQLKATGTIRGTFSQTFLPTGPGKARLFVQVFGLDRLAVADSVGGFALTGLPEAIYVLRFFSDQAALGEVRREAVAVSAGQETGLDTVELAQGCADSVCDTAVVRAILDGNGLASVPVAQVAEFDSIAGRLVSLHLSEKALKGLHLKQVPADIQRLKALRELDLSSNFLTEVPGEIASLGNLVVLKLAENRLSAAPPGLGSLIKLEWLDLSQNLLEFLPAGLERLKALRHLNLEENRLTGLPDGIGSLDSLRDLSLVNNELQIFPVEILSLKNLRRFNMKDNFLSSLPASIWAMPELRYLSLSNNALRELPAPTENQSVLDSLYLGKNDLAALPAGITRLEGLEFLYLRGNRLCAPASQIETWIASFDPDWKGTQYCP